MNRLTHYLGAHPVSVCWFVLLSAVQPAPAAEIGNQRPLAELLRSLSTDRMLDDVAYLSSGTLNGRQAGTPDDLASGLFVAQRFHAVGLQPAGPQLTRPSPAEQSGSRRWMMTGRATARQIRAGARLEVFSDRVTIPEPGTDYLPILDSPSVHVTAPIVFVGYGISDPAHGFDEYEGVNVQNRIVLFLRGKPRRFPVRVSHAEKERVAREKGAVAYLTATGPILSAYEARRGLSTKPLAYYGRSAAQGQRPLPGAWISPALADKILSPQGSAGRDTLRALQERLNERLAPQSREADTLVRMTWQSRASPGRLINILGLIHGEGPAAHETVVLGAHRDHFGRQSGLLFPGADDNASGTAILLEVARVLMQSGIKPKRSVLFASFSGEEQGLLGSRLYASHPARPLNSTVAMINVDHAGVGNGRLTVGVAGLPKDRAAEAGRLAGLADQLDLYGYFPGGDHVPFKEAGVPTIAVVSSGPHPHFHQPSDRVETLQPEILGTVARYVIAVSWLLAHTP